MASYQYVVRGRVQGVGYRYFVLKLAEELGVAGFARNRPDGGVEVIAEAEAGLLERFEERLREGPAFSTVEHVERAPVPPRGDLGFHIR